MPTTAQNDENVALDDSFSAHYHRESNTTLLDNNADSDSALKSNSSVGSMPVLYRNAIERNDEIEAIKNTSGLDWREEQKPINFASHQTTVTTPSVISQQSSSNYNRGIPLLSVPSVSGNNFEEFGSVLLRQHEPSVTSFGRTHTGWKRFMGIFFAVAAGFVFIFASVSSKKLVETSYTPGEVGFFRFVFVPICALPFLIYNKTNPFSLALLKQHGLLLCFRGLIGSTAFLLRIVTLARIPLGDATTIFFTTPIFVGIMAKLFLGERYHKTYLISTGLAFCGCLLISRPSFLFPVAVIEDVDDEARAASAITRLEGCAAALTSAVIGGGVYVVLRKLRKVDIAVTLWYFGLGGMLSSGTWSLLATHALPWPREWMDWMWVLIMGAASNIGQSLFTRAFQYENANVIALFGAGDIVWAFLAQFVFFGVVPRLLSLAGAALIVTSVLFVAMRKLIESLPETNRTRQRLMTWRVCIWCMPSIAPPKRHRNRRKQSITSLSTTAILQNGQKLPNITVFVAADDDDYANDKQSRTFAVVRPENDRTPVDAVDVDIVEKAFDELPTKSTSDDAMVAEAVALAASGEGGVVPSVDEAEGDASKPGTDSSDVSFSV